MNRIQLAANIAKAAHAGQTRKYTGRPYIEHPGRVAMQAMLLDMPEEAVCAAWLHDTLEDTELSTMQLQDMMGDRILDLVGELTNEAKEVIPHETRAVRKAWDVARLGRASHRAKAIKCLDRADNLRDLWGAPFDSVSLYVKESMNLLEAIRANQGSPDWHYLATKILEAEIRRYLDDDALIIPAA